MFNRIKKYATSYFTAGTILNKKNKPDILEKKNKPDILDKIELFVTRFIFYLHCVKDKYPKYKEGIESLYAKTNIITFIDTKSKNGVYSGYGMVIDDRKLFLDINDYKYCGININDINHMICVSVQKLTQAISLEYGHTPLFKEIYDFLIERARELRRKDMLNILVMHFKNDNYIPKVLLNIVVEYVPCVYFDDYE